MPAGDPLVGYRIWHTNERWHPLEPVEHNSAPLSTWNREGATEAACIPQRHLEGIVTWPHAIPCTDTTYHGCGLSALSKIEDAAAWIPWSMTFVEAEIAVIGRVALWGRIIRELGGWDGEVRLRAEFGEVVELFPIGTPESGWAIDHLWGRSFSDDLLPGGGLLCVGGPRGGFLVQDTSTVLPGPRPGKARAPDDSCFLCARDRRLFGGGNMCGHRSEGHYEFVDGLYLYQVDKGAPFWDPPEEGQDQFVGFSSDAGGIRALQEPIKPSQVQLVQRTVEIADLLDPPT